MTAKPRITLIIPTRERADVLQSALHTAVTQDYDNLEILVADNFSQDNTRDVVLSQTDKRVRYINSGKRLNMSANWDFALSSLRKTEFVAIMGDDDGILPGGIARSAEVLVATGTRALRTKSCNYHWPIRNGKEHGRLLIKKQGGIEVRSGLEWLKKVLSEGVPYENLPVIYNGGVIHIDELRKMNRNGRYFHSAIPDVFSGVALASVVGEYAFLNEQLFINGASQHSTGTSQFANTIKVNTTSGKTPAQRFLGEGNIPFHPLLPMTADGNYPKSIRAMVYECYLQSAFLRDGVELTSPKQQLTNFISASSDKLQNEEVQAWCKMFAKQNNLSYVRAKINATPTIAALFARYIIKKYLKKRRNRNAKIFDAPKWPLLTVADAAQLASDQLAAFQVEFPKNAN
jgi:glycosyltransferase involved in cell wall biosynthesis